MELVCVIMSANSAHVLLKSRTDANPNARLESIMNEMNSEQGNSDTGTGFEKVVSTVACMGRQLHNRYISLY